MCLAKLHQEHSSNTIPTGNTRQWVHTGITQPNPFSGRLQTVQSNAKLWPKSSLTFEGYLCYRVQYSVNSCIHKGLELDSEQYNCLMSEVCVKEQAVLKELYAPNLDMDICTGQTPSFLSAF